MNSDDVNNLPELAAQNSLQPQALADLIGLKKFAEAQINAFRLLWGAELSSSRAREHLLRLIVIEFGFSRLRQRIFYIEALASLFNTNEILIEFSCLEDNRLIICNDDGKVAPSQLVIDWYNRVMPALMEEASHVIQSR